jgi:hypothetical protein
MKFKTVTLGDLRLEEMKAIILEYRKLLLFSDDRSA